MNRSSIVSFEFSSDWNVLKDLREQLLSYLQDKLEHMAEPIVMTSLELVGNAIKYGEAELSFALDIDGDYIDIKVANTLGKDGDYNVVAEIIDKITASRDPFELYVERLQELLTNPASGPSRIGLIRIAYEGKFELSSELNENRVLIRARRRVEKGAIDGD